MWFIQILIGILLGWYLNPFKDGSAFRNKTNEVIGKLFGAIASLFDKNQEDEEIEYEGEEPANDEAKTHISAPPISNKSSHPCPSCGESMIIPTDKAWKGYLICEKCNKVDPIKVGAM
jgi:predicted RNA-binding Zn-ribbon protein involved in translation (DUF1610 family)